MYFPFMRGKQHELAALKKTSPHLDRNKIRPIIEPVKKDFKRLISAVTELNKHGISPLILINPIEGDMKSANNFDLYVELVKNSLKFLPCVSFTTNSFQVSSSLVTQLIQDNIEYSTYFKDEPTQNSSIIVNNARINTVRKTNNTTNHFLTSTPNLVQISDSFSSQSRNADYPTHPYIFSDAHLTYTNNPNMIGFGDYQIVGESFSESGGPARAVALHITYIDAASNNLMLIKHCVSVSNNGTTTGTAAKFLEALNDLINFANATPSVDQSTLGFKAFLSLYNRQHYPNLGPAKENSIMHHIETINNYL